MDTIQLSFSTFKPRLVVMLYYKTLWDSTAQFQKYHGSFAFNIRKIAVVFYYYFLFWVSIFLFKITHLQRVSNLMYLTNIFSGWLTIRREGRVVSHWEFSANLRYLIGILFLQHGTKIGRFFTQGAVSVSFLNHLYKSQRTSL